MKFKLVENYLFEDIEAVRKQYSKISDDNFYRLIRLDPTFDENRDSVGTYGKWILNLFNKGKLDNIGHVKDLLTRFEENKKYLLNKDINRFKSLEEVDDYLNDDNNYKEKSHRQEVRDNQKARRNADTDEDYITSADGFDIYVPSSYANSCKLGQGTTWCTASTETDTYYNMYKEDYGGDYYILINKSNPKEKYQFHFESNQFMDSKDYSIDLTEFLYEHTGIKEFFVPKMLEILGMPKDAELSDEVSIKLSYNKLKDIFNNCEKCGTKRDPISGETIVKILMDPYELFFEWSSDYFPGVSEALRYVSLDNDSVKEELLRLGIINSDTDNIEDAIEEYIDNGEDYSDDVESAIRMAYIEAEECGAANAAYEDVVSALKGVFPNVDIDYNDITFTFTYQDAIDNFCTDENYSTSDPLELFVASSLINNFELYEPYYGWQDFDDDAFIDRLADELYQIK